jgi:hypothetical protein
MKGDLAQPVPALIHWVDSASRSDSWTDIDSACAEARKLPQIRTLGFIIRVTRHFVLLVRSHDDYHRPSVDGVFQIPRGCIQRIVKLRERPSRATRSKLRGKKAARLGR